MLNKDFVKIKGGFESKSDVFKYISDILVEEGFVKENYLENLIKREEEYPTGISSGSIGFAIPHTEFEFVNESTLFIVKLEEPMLFKDMVGVEDAIEVELIFNLVLAESEKENHIVILKNIMGIMHDETIVEAIKTVKTQDALYKLLEKEFETEGELS